MDSKNAVALTVGLGALGTVLAYFGYNHLNLCEDTGIQNTSKTIVTADEFKNDQMSTIVKEEISKKVSMAIKEIDKTQPDTDVHDVLSTDSEKWKTYWAKQYSPSDKDEIVAE